MSIRTATVLVLIAVIHPGGQRLYADPPVRVELALDKDQYEVGEPIELTIRLTNVSNAILEIPWSSEVTGRLDGYSFVVRGENGAALADPLMDYLRFIKALGSFKTLPPGNTYSRTLTLNYWTPPLKPGKCSVTGFYQRRGGGPNDQAESPILTLRIAETRPADLEARVSRLARELRTGGDARKIAPLLGFTGHTAAIAPLVDLFYAMDDGARYEAGHSLVFLDDASVKAALFESLKIRGPRDRLIHFLLIHRRAKPEEVKPLLLQWLDNTNGDARSAAVDGLRLLNVPTPDPQLFRPLAARLQDPLPGVRHPAAAAVGAYADAAAFRALKAVVSDTDSGVREQATIAVGWVAKAAETGNPLRQEAVEVLKAVRATGGAAAQQADYWLGQIGEK